MHFKKILTSSIGVLVLSSAAQVAQAQDAAKAASATPTQAAMIKAAVALPVKGLTEKNQQKALMAVEALSLEAFVCPGCRDRQPEAGSCEGCGKELKPEKFKLVQKAEALSKEGNYGKQWLVKLTLAPGEKLRLSQVEGALKKEEVSVERANYELTGAPVLIFKGASTAAEAMKLQALLQEARLFDEVQAKFDERTMETRVKIKAGAKPSMYAAIVAIGEKAMQPMRLVDVQWTGSEVKPITASSPVDK